MFKPLVAATCALALGAGATVVFAQDPSTPPTVTVGVGKSQVTLQGADGVKGGPTRFVFTNSDKVKETFGGIFALKSGTTVEDFKRETARGLNHVWGMGSVEASATLEGASDQRVVTADLQPGGSYIAFQAQSEDPKKWVVTPFSVAGESNGAKRTAPAATVSLDDFRFTGAKTLPRKGVVRFQNVGAAPHFAVAFPLKKGASVARAGRAIRANNEKAFGKFIGGAPSEPQGLITPGAVNDTEVSFAKAGRYLLVCFFSTSRKTTQHNQIGMYRAVTVK